MIVLLIVVVLVSVFLEGLWHRRVFAVVMALNLVLFAVLVGWVIAVHFIITTIMNWIL